MSGRLRSVIAFTYTVGAGLMLFGLHRYATSDGGHDPESATVRLAVLAMLAGALLLAAPSALRRWAALRSRPPS